MASNTRCAFLCLPAELRMAIYEAYVNDLTTRDAFELTRLRHYSGATIEERDGVKSYSFLFTLPTIYKEALSLVVQSHPILFLDAADTLAIRRDRLTYQNRIRAVRLDFGVCGGKVMHDALRNLAILPAFEAIEVYLPQSHLDGGVGLPDTCSYCPYVSLQNFYVVDKEAQRPLQTVQTEMTEMSGLRRIENQGIPLSREEQALMARLCLEQTHENTVICAESNHAQFGTVAEAARHVRMLNKRLAREVRQRKLDRLKGRSCIRQRK